MPRLSATFLYHKLCDMGKLYDFLIFQATYIKENKNVLRGDAADFCKFNVGSLTPIETKRSNDSFEAITCHLPCE